MSNDTITPVEAREHAYTGLEAQEPDSTATIADLKTTLLRKLQVGRTWLYTLIVQTMPAASLGYSTGQVNLAAGASTQLRQTFPHRCVSVEAWNFDTTNPLVLVINDDSGQGGVNGPIYIAANTYYVTDILLERPDVTLSNPSTSAAVEGQLKINGW